jgi:thiamine biosynthesis lipoprotein
MGVASAFSQEIITGFAQGTSYKIVYYPEHQAIQKSQVDAILQQLDSSLSIYKPYSLISQFNHPETSEIKVDKHLKNVLAGSFKHWKLSKGKFDITVAPLSELYGLGNKAVSPSPSPAQIKSALDLVGMKNISLVQDMLIKHKPGVKIDVNGIAQGYSVDVLAEFLESKDIHNYLVELGGEIKTKGTHPDGRKFKIALEIPSKNSDSLQYKTLEIYHTAITTSGAKKHHHINPKTGKIYSTAMLSVSVFAKTAMDADAFDNYIIAMKPKKVKKIAGRKNIEVILTY